MAFLATYPDDPSQNLPVKVKVKNWDIPNVSGLLARGERLRARGVRGPARRAAGPSRETVSLGT
jgi:hypothetical protein